MEFTLFVCVKVATSSGCLWNALMWYGGNVHYYCTNYVRDVLLQGVLCNHQPGMQPMLLLPPSALIFSFLMLPK